MFERDGEGETGVSWDPANKTLADRRSRKRASGRLGGSVGKEPAVETGENRQTGRGPTGRETGRGQRRQAGKGEEGRRTRRIELGGR